MHWRNNIDDRIADAQNIETRTNGLGAHDKTPERLGKPLSPETPRAATGWHMLVVTVNRA